MQCIYIYIEREGKINMHMIQATNDSFKRSLCLLFTELSIVSTIGLSSIYFGMVHYEKKC
jgi:hypothetical protein